MPTLDVKTVPANEASCGDLRAIFGTRGDTSRCHCQRYKMQKGRPAERAARRYLRRLRRRGARGGEPADASPGRHADRLLGVPGTRTIWLRAVALAAAVASLTINFGLIDLIDGFTGYVDEARNQVLDVGWGAIFGVVLPVGLLAQLRRPERRIAGVQQTAVVALALAIAGVAGGSWWYLALAGGIAAVAAVVLALHPARQSFLERGRQPDPTMLALAAVAAGPTLVYAWRTAAAQRTIVHPPTPCRTACTTGP